MNLRNFLLKSMNYNLKFNRKLCSAKNDLGIRIYSCVKKKKVPLVLKNPVYSSFYTCGPTTYDSAHIGHASTYVRLDIVQRILREYFKINLVTAMNVTNIDDKIIRRSLELDKDWKILAAEYEHEFWEDLKSLNVRIPDIIIRVTDKIPEIIKFTNKILEKGFAYKTEDGSVYFKTEAYKNYGKLQNIILEDKDHDSKENSSNFALWKGVKPNEPYWDTSFGKGRPGWHIECSTMASLLFGNQLDFHAGGVDLRFPHHENEEAQSCVYHNVEDWVSYWIHTGHLHLPGQKDKMSKSLKNTVSIREMLEHHSANEFRIACLLSHYRSSIEFGPELLTTSEIILRKVQAFVNDSGAYIQGIKPNSTFNENLLVEKIRKCQEEVDVALKDDFNTASALGSLQDLMSTVNKIINNSDIEKYEASSNLSLIQSSVNYVTQMFQIFGVKLASSEKSTESGSQDVNTNHLIDEIIRVRNEIRLKAKETKNKELFKVCDELRSALGSNQIEVKDHGNLSSWNYKKI